MKLGQAFEIFVKRILLNIGFSGVKSDGLYIFNGTPGQMIQGLGEAHNADVLLEPPVQTPFYARTRLLVECKDYSRKVGLNTVRSVLGLREDINHFDIVDLAELKARRQQNRRLGIIHNYERYSYQVAIAGLSGYTIQAQKFAATYRIPLLEFNKMPFWNRFLDLTSNRNVRERLHEPYTNTLMDAQVETQIIDFADEIGKRMAVAITNSGQMLFLYRTAGEETKFSDYYSLHWEKPNQFWSLNSGEQEYVFQLPDNILKLWLENSGNDLEMKKEAINCKANFLSNMIVYFTEYGRPVIKMISIDKTDLERARKSIQL